MPLADAWGATIDRTVTGSIMLTLDVMLPVSRFDDTLEQRTVSVTEAFDEAKPGISGAFARYRLAAAIVAHLTTRHPVLFRLWNARCQYARFVWKILAYQDLWDTHDAIRRTLPANQRNAYKIANMDPLQIKLDRFPAYRDRYAADAGEV